MDALAVSRAPVTSRKAFWGPRSVFGIFNNLSIQIKASAASAVLLICLLALGANAYMTSTKSAEGLRMLSHEIEGKLQAVSNVSDAIVTTHLKIFRYVSWASNSVSKKLLDSLQAEINANLAELSRRIDELSRRPDLSDAERASLRDLQARWKKCISQAKDTIDVGQTDAAMATMMLGQTDDSFKAVYSDIQKLSLKTIGAANAVRNSLYADAERTKEIIILGTVLGFMISAFVSFMVGASIVRPIKSITDVMAQLSAGKTDVEISHRDRRDEIGKMVQAIDVFRKNMIEIRSMEQATHLAEQHRVAERRAAMHELAGEFEKSVQQIAEELTEAVSAMHSNAEAMSLIAAQTRDKSQSTAGIVIDTQSNVNSVANAAEELAKSIEQLAAQTHNARELTNKTVAESANASANVQQLLDAVSQIVPITGLIQAIAQQTNLLALNATIEAARAGSRRQGLCRGRGGSQIAGAADGESHRGNQSEDYRGERLVRRRRRHHGAGHQRDRPARRRNHGDGLGGRPAGGRHPGNLQERATGRRPVRASSPAISSNWTTRRAKTTTPRARRWPAPSACSITPRRCGARSTSSCSMCGRPERPQRARYHASTFVTATQSISTSNGPGHEGTCRKMRAGDSAGK